MMTRHLTATAMAVGAIACAALLSAAGCGGPASGGSLRVVKIAAVAQQPANIAAYVSVHDKKGDAVTDLDATDFAVWEDNKLISDKKAKRAMLDVRPMEARYLLILVDLSGPVVDSEDLPDMVAAVGKLAESAGRNAQVAISLFDGEDEIVPMLGFGASGGKAALEALRHFRPRNRNGNLNGAVVQGLDVLEKQLASATAPFAYSALMVVTDRGDLAHKVTAEDLGKRLASTAVSVYVAGVGAKADRKELEPIGKAGLFVSSEPKDLTKGLSELGKRMEAEGNARYLFSYCTNKRQGDHKLILLVNTGDDLGRITHEFSAGEFKNGCLPKHRPQFDKPAK
jgi:hypothetical protein